MQRTNTSERLSGPWRILANASVSDVLRRALGRANVVRTLADDYIKPSAGETVIDFGCGLGGILSELANVEYLGVDVDDVHITAAAERYKGQGAFRQVDLLTVRPEDLGRFDVVLARGFLHHLNDHEAATVLALAQAILKPDGRIITIDPVRSASQNPISTMLVNLDRGSHVRRSQGYRALLNDKFDVQTCEIRHDLLRVPYSHCIMIGRPRQVH